MLDLLDFPKLLGMSFTEENLANRIKAVLVDVKKLPEESNAEYKMDALQEGDLVMAYLRKECFPAGTCHQLKNKNLALIRYSSRSMTMPMLMSFLRTWLFLLHSTFADLSEYHAPEQPVYPEINSRVSSSQVEGTDVEQVAEQYLEQEDHKKSS